MNVQKRRARPGPAVTGVLNRHDGQAWLEYERVFDAGVREVWSMLTDPDMMRGWAGTWTGDPETGQVEFTLTGEGEPSLPVPYRLLRVDPPYGFAVAMVSAVDDRLWPVEADLVEQGPRTVLRFRQAVVEPAFAASIGAGCEFYLARLEQALLGADPGLVSFDDYVVSVAAAYRAMFPPQRRSVED